MKRLELSPIRIHWRDHCWVDVKDRTSIEAAQPYEIHELGFLLSEDDTKIVYCARVTEGFDGKKNNVEYENSTIVLKTDIIELTRL